MEMENFKHRSSSIGGFIGKRGHALIAKGELDKLRIGWHEDFRSIQTDKGKEQEAVAREIYSQVFAMKGQFIEMFAKNINNDFITGTPDILHGDLVVDTKIAFNRLTFSKASLEWVYLWQLRCYMWLTKKTKARLFYCMTETPDHLMSRLEQKLFYTGDYTTIESPEYLQAKVELHKMHDISKVPFYKRFKFWDVSLEDSHIDIIKKIVQESRIYMAEEARVENNLFETNRLLMLAKANV